MRPRTSVLVWPVLAHAAAWAAFLWLALWPASYRGTSVEMDSAGTYTTTSHTASLVAVNGPMVLLPLFMPVALTGLALLAVWRWNPRPWIRRAFLWVLALLSLAFCLLGILSIGVFFLPSAVALVVTAVVCTFRTHGRGEGAGNGVTA